MESEIYTKLTRENDEPIIVQAQKIPPISDPSGELVRKSWISQMGREEGSEGGEPAFSVLGCCERMRMARLERTTGGMPTFVILIGDLEAAQQVSTSSTETLGSVKSAGASPPSTSTPSIHFYDIVPRFFDESNESETTRERQLSGPQTQRETQCSTWKPSTAFIRMARAVSFHCRNASVVRACPYERSHALEDTHTHTHTGYLVPTCLSSFGAASFHRKCISALGNIFSPILILQVALEPKRKRGKQHWMSSSVKRDHSEPSIRGRGL